MKATLMMVGLAALVGCGAEESSDSNAATPPSTTAALTAWATNAPAAQAKGSEAAATTETVAPRVARFAILPAGGLPAGSVASKVWSRDTRPTLPEAGAAVVSQFDPAQAARVEAERLSLQPLGGVK